MSFITSNIEILILIIIIIVLFFMFIRVLGKKIGYKEPEKTVQHVNLDTLYNKGEALIEKKENIYPEGSLQYKIHKISEAQTNFNVKSFIEQSKKAFLLITEKFNKGELEDIKPFVSDNIFNILHSNRQELTNQNKSILFRFDTFLIADIYDINLDENKIATIKVKFVTRQMKKIIQKSIINKKTNSEDLSHKDLSQYTDMWVFTKNLKDNVSIWKLEKILSV